MIVGKSTEFFPVATKPAPSNPEKSTAFSFEDCMKDSASNIQDKKTPEDIVKNQTNKSDFKKDSYQDSYSRVKEVANQKSQNVKELSKDDLEQMSDELKEKIMDSLSVSIEELEEVMSALNLSWMDLLNPDKLKMLVLACEGKGQVDLLTDENLNQCYQNVLEGLKEVLEEHGTDVAQVESFVQTLGESDYLEVYEDVKKAALQEKEFESVQKESTDSTVLPKEKKDSEPKQPIADTSSKDEKSFQGKRKAETELKNDIMGKEQVTTVIGQDFQKTITTVKETDGSGIVSQIVTQVKVMVSEDTSSIQMQLYPEHLGKLSIQISERSGAMTAQFLVESEEAKQALVSSMNELKDAFQEQNLRITEIEVSVAPKSFEQQEQSSKDHSTDSKKSGKTGMKNLRLDDLLNEETMELLEEEKIAVELMQLNGNSVDFTA